jgi:nucleotide-binding universal stress UspA family protein
MTAQHFLVPIDFSSYAEQALDSAIALAQKLQARVTLLHVIQPPGVNVAGGIWPSATFLQDLEAAVTRDMEGYLVRVTAAGLAGEIVIVHGVPFQEILDTAKARQVDLIIMGTHGRTGLSHVLLGSVAEGVAFTAAQIPSIAERRYPASLAGPSYPDGIPIYPETDLERLITTLHVDEVVFAYSDVANQTVMLLAQRVLAAGVTFTFLGPRATMLASQVPVIAVCAVRTGFCMSRRCECSMTLRRSASLHWKRSCRYWHRGPSCSSASDCAYDRRHNSCTHGNTRWLWHRFSSS